jgi:type VI secretion system secreted protein VgrG
MAITQDNQIITIDSPLGKDVLLMHSFRAAEHISAPFSIEAEVSSTEDAIDPSKIVGKSVTIKVASDSDYPRFFNGVVSRWAAGGSADRVTYKYYLTVVPWLSLLKYRQASRIFQEQSVKDILSSIFDELGFTDYEWKLQKTYEPRLYCVQYRETDFDFTHRMLEEEGVFYYFKHEDGKHTLVLSDYAKGYDAIDKESLDVIDGSHTDFTIKQWRRSYNFVSGKVELNDYNFTTPATSLSANQKSLVNLPNLEKFEIYDYPGEYGVKAEGTNYATTRMEALESGYSLVEAASDYPGLTPGFIFTIGEHWDKNEKKAKYVVTSVIHSGTEGSYRSGEGGGSYSNSIVCAPAATVMRPLIRTPKPVVGGTQTALVVGPSGEEIFTDEYGRIKVQFYWDREGQKDDTSSCWIRVAQIWAGKKWGAQYLPRIGQEVVISFLEGDPDRPLVIGSVYNAEQMPPYDLPANKTHTGVKSRSSKQGGTANYNEIMFIDEKGGELLRVHAEKDRNITVENDDIESVGHDQSITVGNDQTISVGRDQTEDVGRHRKTTIGENDTESVGKNQDITVGDNQSEDVGKNKTLNVGDNQMISVGKNQSQNVGDNDELNVGKNQAIQIGKDLSEDVGGSYTESVTKDYSLSAKKIQITAKDQIVLKAGKASITLKKSGDITISGGKINIKGSGDVIIKGSQIKEN